MTTIQGRASSGMGDAIPDRIASCAAGSPARIAVADGRRRLTYAELERESDLLAAALVEAGAGPEKCVALLLGRSTHFVVAALAVLKTGAAYVPLDATTPCGRVASILVDAGAVALVTESCFAQALPTGSWQVVLIDRLPPDSVMHFDRKSVDQQTLAYLLYTSGSTGQPKGVEITHANLGNLIDWHQAAFGVTAADRGSQVASFGFDAAGWEIWPYLTAGASVYIADDNVRRSAESLRPWLLSQEITISFVPTLLAEQLFALDWPHETALRLLLTGGDILRHPPTARLPFVVVNNYGPTECTVVATSGVVDPGVSSPIRPSIGRPIANTVALILDEALQLVERGQPGELCIGGASVARGYHNLPELTAKQFVAYASPSGERLRLYRTGDRVRLLENGEIDFLGRLDDQVKIRGYRIEPGEVEACLLQHPEVAECTVVLRTDASGSEALTAYLVSTSGAPLTDTGLRQFLAPKLPDYMVPAFFVSIQHLPLSTNGKLDKAALPQPQVSNCLPSSGAINGAFRGIEQQIADLVTSLMSRGSIGADDNFFMLGGHSMFGVQLVARIREEFGVRLALRQVFGAPTVRELSNEVAHLLRAP